MWCSACEACGGVGGRVGRVGLAGAAHPGSVACPQLGVDEGGAVHLRRRWEATLMGPAGYHAAPAGPPAVGMRIGGVDQA
jgi:hypothetical protein